MMVDSFGRFVWLVVDHDNRRGTSAARPLHRLDIESIDSQINKLYTDAKRSIWSLVHDTRPSDGSNVVRSRAQK